MKKNQLIALLLCILLSLSTQQALAASGDEEAFTESSLLQAGQEDVRFAGSINGGDTMIGDTLYRLSGNHGQIFTWSPGDKTVGTFCSLPEYTGIMNASLPDLDSIVTNLVPMNGELWALNVVEGRGDVRVGKISKESGVTWQEQRIDSTPINGIGMLSHIFTDNGKIYALANLGWRDVRNSASEVVIVELSIDTGKSRLIDVGNADSIAPYKPGNVLLLHGGMTVSPTLSVLELSTGNIAKLPLTIPEKALSVVTQSEPDPLAGIVPMEDTVYSEISGLAYDSTSDAVYFVSHGQLWKSQSGSDFSSVAQLPEDSLPQYIQAWVLPDGRYGAIICGAFFVRGTDF